MPSSTTLLSRDALAPVLEEDDLDFDDIDPDEEFDDELDEDLEDDDGYGDED